MIPAKLLGDSLLVDELRMHANDQHFLIVGAVENGDLPARRHADIRTPQKIVSQLLMGWRFERVHVYALRIDAAGDVLDETVLPLNDDEQCPVGLRIENI